MSFELPEEEFPLLGGEGFNNEDYNDDETYDEPLNPSEKVRQVLQIQLFLSCIRHTLKKRLNSFQ